MKGDDAGNLVRRTRIVLHEQTLFQNFPPFASLLRFCGVLAHLSKSAWSIMFRV
jgi:hypothetical protein